MGIDVSNRCGIKRAAALLQRPSNDKDFITLKLIPAQRRCCCFHCWPVTWATINEFIAPAGPVPDEGDALIHSPGGDYVLECHESGPEIVVYLGVATASLLLIKSVVDLITAFLNALAKDHNSPSRIKLIQRRGHTGQVADDILVEIDLPLTDDMTEILNEKVREALHKTTESPSS